MHDCGSKKQVSTSGQFIFKSTTKKRNKVRQHSYLKVICSDDIERQYRSKTLHTVEMLEIHARKSLFSAFNEARQLSPNAKIACTKQTSTEWLYRFSSSTTAAYPALSPTKS